MQRGTQQRRVLRSTLLGVLALLGLWMTALRGQAQGLAVNGQFGFVRGANLPWLPGQSGSTWGINAHYGNNGYDSGQIEAAFSDLNNLHVNCVRLFLFHGLAGVYFDQNGYVAGLQPELTQNLDDTFNRAANHGIGLYLTLLDGANNSGDDAAYNLGINGTANLNGYYPGPNNIPANTPIANVFTDGGAQSSFIYNAVVPLIARYGNGGAFGNTLFGIDLINESNYSVGGGYYSWDQLRGFIQQTTNAIHNTNYQVRVTASTQHQADLLDSNRDGTYGGLGLDFYDFHGYFYNNGDPNENSLRTVGSDNFNPDVPVNLGECGADFIFGSYPGEQDVANAYQYWINQASGNGWAGSFVWSYYYLGPQGLLDAGNNPRAAYYTVQNVYGSL